MKRTLILGLSVIALTLSACENTDVASPERKNISEKEKNGGGAQFLSFPSFLDNSYGGIFITP